MHDTPYFGFVPLMSFARHSRIVAHTHMDDCRPLMSVGSTLGFKATDCLVLRIRGKIKCKLQKENLGKVQQMTQIIQ